jgi:hypothetical protein
MSAGAETLLLSRWRVGGQSTLDLVREFVRELPHTGAADAWQRSVQLAMEMPIDPLSELRVQAGKEPVALTAAHPFFWAGYLVVDSGWRPAEPEADATLSEPGVAAAPGARQAPDAAEQALPPAAVAPPGDVRDPVMVKPPADAAETANAVTTQEQPSATPPAPQKTRK